MADELPTALSTRVPTDARWAHALDGLPVMGFHSLDHGRKTGEWIYHGEVTGHEDHYLFVAVAGEDEPRRVHWSQVRPA